MRVKISSRLLKRKIQSSLFKEDDIAVVKDKRTALNGSLVQIVDKVQDDGRVRVRVVDPDDDYLYFSGGSQTALLRLGSLTKVNENKVCAEHAIRTLEHLDNMEDDIEVLGDLMGIMQTLLPRKRQKELSVELTKYREALSLFRFRHLKNWVKRELCIKEK